MLVLPRCPMASGQALPVLLRHCVLCSAQFTVDIARNFQRISLHSLVIFSTFCCKRQELIFQPVPHIDSNIQPSSPPEQTSLWPGWARRAANAASPGFSRKEGSGEAGLNPNTSPHRFLSGKCVSVYYEGKSEGVAKTMGGDDEK